MKKTLITTIIATILVCCCIAGTTYAWLVAKSDTVQNTFTFGDINITLTETGAENNAQTFQVVPGKTIAKDPKVTVLANSEACWLFVEIKETNNKLRDENIISYEMKEDQWTPLAGVEGVYYIEINAQTTADTAYYVFEGNTENPNGVVTVNGNVTKADLTTIATSQPLITVTAYAVQKEGISTATAAWSVATTGALPTT